MVESLGRKSQEAHTATIRKVAERRRVKAGRIAGGSYGDHSQSRGATTGDSLGRKSQDSFGVQFAKSRSDDG